MSASQTYACHDFNTRRTGGFLSEWAAVLRLELVADFALLRMADFNLLGWLIWGGIRTSHHTQKTENHGRIVGPVSTSERPASAEDRMVPGHWEGDLLFGCGNSQIATLVERQTRYLMLVKIPAKDTETVVGALIKHARKLPQELYKSLTWDRGKELAAHQRFTLATDIRCSSAIRRAPGNVARTRMPMGGTGSI